MEITSVIKPLVFYVFAAIAVGSAMMVVILRNPLYSAATLVLTFFAIAGIYVIMGSEIIAVFQVLVYAGAIMVLVIFVIMFLNLRPSLFKMNLKHVFRSSIAVVFSLTLFISLISLFSKGVQFYMQNARKGDITSAALNSEGSFLLFSKALFTEYLLPFELTSLLLTVAIIGVVVLIRGMTKHSESGSKLAAQKNQGNSQEKKSG